MTFSIKTKLREEAVVNALYHRDYQEREPVEITIEPDKISILSYAGPDRSVTLDAIKKGDVLRSRRYRNRRLGDFLKELELTEGRCTGIPTIQEELSRNGSPRAIIETDEDRTYFLIDIPCHEGIEIDLSKENIELSQGVNELSQGVNELSQGANELSQGVNEFSQGVNEFSQGVNHKQRIRNKDEKENLIKKLILFCKEPKTLDEITTIFGFKDKYHFKKVYINPILGKLIFMTEPNHPQSPSQKYTSTKQF
ncbi:MAG: hypothetical protein IJ513_02050 [Bacteroidaceae bacterium]|nr:hypothetical protein [Bacteroidaceae bacterium]